MKRTAVAMELTGLALDLALLLRPTTPAEFIAGVVCAASVEIAGLVLLTH